MRTLICDGTGATPGRNSDVVMRFAQHLEKKHGIKYEIVEYPAKYIIGGMSYRASVDAGKKALRAAIDKYAGETLILVGFSQGCTVVGDVLREDSPKNCIGALIADPHRPENSPAATFDAAGNPTWANVPGSGIGGEKYIKKNKAFYAANEKDMITAASRDSLWRTFADVTEWLGPNLDRTFTDLSAKLAKQLFQNWGAFRLVTLLPRIATAEKELYGYSKGGEHNAAYVRGEYGLVERLADAISWYIRQEGLIEA